jgi:amino-acid N-acetyltransferase
MPMPLALADPFLPTTPQAAPARLDVIVRAARLSDVPAMHAIINSHAELGRMLFKSYAELYENIRDFAVAQHEASAVVGCVAVGVIWADLAEVRSLAVAESMRGRGVGRALVDWCLQDARRLQIRKLMSLTYEQTFFEKLGFVVVQKESLPLKVWTDCVKCPKNHACDEIAMIRELPEVAPIEAPKALPTPRGVKIPVLDD